MLEATVNLFHRFVQRIMIVSLANLVVAVNSTAAYADDGLTLSISTDLSIEGVPAIDLEKPFQVIFRNNSDEDIRLGRSMSQHGNFCLTIEATNLVTREVFLAKQRKDEDDGYLDTSTTHSENGSSITIAPHETFTIHVDLTSVDFEDVPVWTGIPEPNNDQKYSIQAKYQVLPEKTPENSIWTGSLSSDPLDVFVISEQIDTPHEYIEFDLTNLAIRVMANDLDWIDRKDEYERTPLHIAARHGRLEAVKWLLDNGADVNAPGYNKYTPLHTTTDPETVKLILQYHPDLTIKCGGDTPLRAIIDRLYRARSEEEEDRWHSIIAMYLEAGAEYDIITAIHRNDLKRVKVISDNPVNPIVEHYNDSPLRRAASLGRLEICKYLITEKGEDVNQFEQGIGYPIIKEALARPEIVRLLIENGADLNKRMTWRGNSTGFVHFRVGNEATALHFAAVGGGPETIILLIDAGVDIFAEARDWFTNEEIKQTALDIAAYYGEADNAEAIINHPAFDEAKPDLRQKLLDKCLIASVRSNPDARKPDRSKLLRVLLKKGADPNATDETGHTAIQFVACEMFPGRDEENEGQKKLIAILLEHGGKLDFFSAVATGDESVVTRMLKEDPLRVNSNGPNAFPVLHCAVSRDYRNIVDLLLNAGANVEIRNESDETGEGNGTALHIAAIWGRDEIAKRLIEAGADVNARGRLKRTPLHDAARSANVQMMRILLDNSAMIDAKDSEGKTPLEGCQSLKGPRADEVLKVFQEHEGK